MTKCNNKNCEEEATVQIDHSGELVFYCDKDWLKYQNIMNAMGAFIPTAYPVGTVTK